MVRFSFPPSYILPHIQCGAYITYICLTVSLTIAFSSDLILNNNMTEEHSLDNLTSSETELLKKILMDENSTDAADMIDISILQTNLDQFFLIVIGIIIFFMQCGFAFLEAGSVR